MRRRGTVSTPPDVTPASCYPSTPTGACQHCVRYRCGNAPAPEHRHAPVIDGSIACGLLFIARRAA